MADIVAKKAASLHPSCPEVLAKLAKAEDLVTAAATFCARAGAWRLETFGRVKSKIVETASSERHDVVAPAPLKLGGHRPCLEAGSLRWRCVLCLRSAESVQGLRRTQCSATFPTTGVLRKHALWQAGYLTFCRKCSCFSTKRTYGLKTACLGAVPPHSVYRQRLDRMMVGRHPLSNILMGSPGPVNLVQE